ncbi:hypothetical protein BRADO3656 [Bradyrhizobium sp. ORS 278]|uniref:hypothetical protein n=1 Tax=Bradyrhizobium sp. (strain ORS 278) TaxID=114615 RepID=UPI000150800C|nr:hypothetical protein [Bradyrhizobium sp. ORS 278]CAL77433.1 hypothetical protein BRADO3656 [Bradyrhizobium sp. ORS 278]
MRKPLNLSREEIERRRAKDREEALGAIRDSDVARGRLESWSGGRVNRSYGTTTKIRAGRQPAICKRRRL